jgi:hypothetical protein
MVHAACALGALVLPTTTADVTTSATIVPIFQILMVT